MNYTNRVSEAIINNSNGPNNQSKQDSFIQRLGTWTKEENIKYAIFMDFHKNQLSSRQKRRDYKMFDHLAKFIGSRNSTQCRSHHQKFENKFRGIKAIINMIKEESGKAQYKASFKQYRPILTRMRLDQHKEVRPTTNVQVQTQINWIKDFKDESKQNHKPETLQPVVQNQPVVHPQIFSAFSHPYYLPMFFPHF